VVAAVLTVRPRQVLRSSARAAVSAALDDPERHAGDVVGAAAEVTGERGGGEAGKGRGRPSVPADVVAGVFLRREVDPSDMLRGPITVSWR
jgi:hypothetical protein